MILESVSVPGRGQELSGLRYRPERELKRFALILAHGFTSGKYSMDSLASYLATRGYDTLTFDFVGHKLGASGGRMETMAQAPGNLTDALTWFRSETDAEGVILIGHSMGAAAAIVTAAWETARLASPELIGKSNSRSGDRTSLAGIVCLCMGLSPSSGFDSPIGQAMLEQRRDYVAGAPALTLLREIDGLVGSVRDIRAIPSLFIAARQDVLLTVERVRELAALAPESTLVEIDSSHLEAPDRSRAAIYSWLTRLESSGTLPVSQTL